jgi:ABC-2 type transport system ATP-binding protein|tara:strand:+ start:368 stop:1303 length:936 start_codon:yes stop_codon:yes gene_type:complete
MSQPAISIRGLRKQYGSLTALDGIDLEVAEGEFFGLLGPNGAGKTTTINVMAGLCIRSAGDVRIHGHDVTREYRECRRLLGLVPQEFNFDQFILLKRMLVFQGGFFGIPLKESAARTDAILETFNLTDKRGTQIRHLSGGMKRRAIIARALIHRPRVLILDEPTAGVDVDLRKMLWKFLRQLNAEGTTIVLTTHYIEEAEALCDRIAIINEGRIVANDRTKNLVSQLSHDSIVVTATSPIPQSAVDQLAAYDPHLDSVREEMTLTFDKSRTAYQALVQQVFAAGIQVDHLGSGENRLERVFMQLTKGARRE